jgi:Coenzyme PQQ synthesis protein D (PqqD)
VGKSAWVVNSPAVVSEIIDGELVVMNLTTGNYFSSNGTGPYVWSCIENKMARDALAPALAAAYGVLGAQAEADIARFITSLTAEGLVREGDSDPTAAGSQAAVGAHSSYLPPELTVYSDMRDLLLLDPIHDVAEEGWPARPPEFERSR